jgi:hypothetical protein
MTKQLNFDLEFPNADNVVGISVKGKNFLVFRGGELMTARELYHKAIKEGLHVRFQDAETRDKLTS